MRKSTVVLFIKALISICFFGILFSFLQESKLMAAFSNIDMFFFSLSMLIVPVMLCTSCMKWWVLIAAVDKKVPFTRLTGIYLIGYFFSNILPSTVGGDVVRSYYAGKELDNQSSAAAATVIERLSGFLLLLILVVVAPLCRPGLYASVYVLFPALGASVLLILIVSLYWQRRAQRSGAVFRQKIGGLFHFVGKKIDSQPIQRVCSAGERSVRAVFLRLESFGEKMINAMQMVRGNKTLLFKIIFLTVLFYFLTWVNVYIAFRTFGYRVDFFTLIALVPTILLVSQLPVTLLGNLGFFESVFVLYFLVIGVPGEVTLAMGLLLRFKMFCLGIAGFGVYLFHRQTGGDFRVRLEKD